MQINLEQFTKIKQIMSGGQVSQFSYDLKTFNTNADLSINTYRLDKKLLSIEDSTMSKNQIQVYISDNQVEKIKEIIK